MKLDTEHGMGIMKQRHELKYVGLSLALLTFDNMKIKGCQMIYIPKLSIIYSSAKKNIFPFFHPTREIPYDTEL